MEKSPRPSFFVDLKAQRRGSHQYRPWMLRLTRKWIALPRWTICLIISIAGLYSILFSLPRLLLHDHPRNFQPPIDISELNAVPILTATEQYVDSVYESDLPRDASCQEILDYADRLPQIKEIDFEDVVDERQVADWEFEWIYNGTFNEATPQPKQRKADVVFTWLNGSDPGLQSLAEKYDIPMKSSNRYREWDELRYGMRSIFQNVPSESLAGVHLLVKGYNDTAGGHHVQEPSWLDKSSGKVSLVSEQSLYDHQGCLPTFNSLSIENKLHNVKNTKDGLLMAICDDMSILRRMSQTDLHSALFGTPLTLYQQIYIFNQVTEPTTFTSHLADTQRPPVEYTSWLLNERFCKRNRHLEHHSPKMIDQQILKEAMATFPQIALASPQRRFRITGFQIDQWYLSIHFTIERHREALLWSYVMLRSDKNQDGYLDKDERETILNEVKQGQDVKVEKYSRKPVLDKSKDLHKAAKLDEFKIRKPIWTSMDGPSTLRKLSSDLCASNFTLTKCLHSAFGSGHDEDNIPARDVMHNLVHDEYCGDCLIMYLLAHHERGLAPLLPKPDADLDIREKAVRSILRYQHYIADTSFEFVSMVKLEEMKKQFEKLNKETPGFVCLNDDIGTKNESEFQQFKDMFKEFYEKHFPGKSPVEI